MLINDPLSTLSQITQTFAFQGHLLVCKRLRTRVKYRSVSHFPNPHLQLPGKTDVGGQGRRCTSPFKVKAEVAFCRTFFSLNEKKVYVFSDLQMIEFAFVKVINFFQALVYLP